MAETVISIILPSFNRGTLLGATLDSILGQNYTHWECIVVDDGSGDYTPELMEFYCSLDGRIKFYQRPDSYPKGANSCRNFGLEKSMGRYVQFFDSDDLMLPRFLEKKIFALEDSNADYVISRTRNFLDPNPSQIVSDNEIYYNFNEFKFSHFNYVVQNFNWLTPDLMFDRRILGNIRFSEILKSAQERNFFSKLTAKSTNALIINNYLTLRRVHPDSTQSRLKSDPSRKAEENFIFLYETFNNLHLYGLTDANQYLLGEAIEYSMFNAISWKYIFGLTLALRKKDIREAVFYFLYQSSIKVSGKGNLFRRWFRNVQREKVAGWNKGKKHKVNNSGYNPLINILTRTSGRPNSFRNCRRSIENQSYSNYRHIISYDDKKDLDYLSNYSIEKIKVSKEVSSIKERELGLKYKPYNLYSNTLMKQVQKGWVMFLDDDDMLLNSNVLAEIGKEISGIDEDTLLIWRTSYPDGKFLPSDNYFAKQLISLREIDTACFIFNSKYINSASWDDEWAADFRYIQKLSRIIPHQKWVNKVFTKKQTMGGKGKRMDIKI